MQLFVDDYLARKNDYLGNLNNYWN
jgi:hypothetical protein